MILWRETGFYKQRSHCSKQSRSHQGIYYHSVLKNIHQCVVLASRNGLVCYAETYFRGERGVVIFVSSAGSGLDTRVYRRVPFD